MNKDICSAIKTKRIITFYYDGGLRRIEPYCHGVTKKGNELLRAFQISGYSRSGNPIGWKLFSLSKIANLKILDDTFQSIRRDYNPKDSAMSRIFCKV